MKYWILTTEFPPKSGGIGTYVKEHAQIYATKGHQVLILYGGAETLYIEEDPIPNITFHTLPLTNQGSMNFLGHEAALSYEFANEVIKLLSKDAPDVIEVQDYLGIGYYLLLKKLLGEPVLYKIPIVVTAHAPSFLYLQHNHTPVYRLPEYWIGEMERFCLLAADLVISPSHYLMKVLKSQMPDGFPDNYAQLFNPYNVRDKIRISAIERKKIVVFGKMSLSKGSLKLMEELNRLWEKGMDFQVNWIGGTDIYLHTEQQTIGAFVQKKYKNLIASGSLCLTGNINPDRINEFLLDAHIVIIPSLVDNLPYTAIEAMAFGKVILASRSGGQAELIEDGINGFLFDWNLPETFEEKLNHILSLSDNQLLKIGESASESIKICSPELYYEKKNQLISKLINDPVAKTIFPIIRPEKKTETVISIELSDGLTVVIPYFNMGAYIEESLDSVYESAYRNINVILINDGSTEEESIAKLAYIKKKYPAIKIMEQANAGLSIARNRGLKLVNTRYVVFLDADDTIHTDYFDKAIKVLEQYENISLVSCWIKYFAESEGIWPSQNPEFPYLLYHNTVHSGSIFKTKDILQIDGYDSSFIYGMEDYEIIINMVSNGMHGVCIPEPLYNYRIRKKSMARSFTVEKQLYLYNLISTKHESIFKKYAKELFNLLNANGPGIFHDNPTLPARFLHQNPLSKNYWTTKIKKLIKRYPTIRKPALVLSTLLKKKY